MAFVKFLLAAIWLAFLQEATSSNSTLNGLWPANLQIEFPYPTFSPANIDTASARPYVTATPLRATFGALERQTVVNTGTRVEVYLSQPATRCQATGGILGNDVYKYFRIQYHWSNDAKGVANSLIDGRSSPLTAVVILYNQKYGSLSNAFLHRDGLLAVAVNVDVEGNVPNPLFTPLEEALCKIKKAGSTTISNGAAVSFSFDVVPTTKYYFAYPGSMVLTDNNGQVTPVTVIQFSRTSTISYSQFKAFQNLENAAGSPVNSRLTAFPMGCRPLVQAVGTSQVVYLS